MKRPRPRHSTVLRSRLICGSSRAICPACASRSRAPPIPIANACRSSSTASNATRRFFWQSCRRSAKSAAEPSLVPALTGTHLLTSYLRCLPLCLAGNARARRAGNEQEPHMLSSAPQQQRLARRTLALVLAGGRGSRLKQLTDRRAKPAVFFGGKFRIIDFALSNCLNSGVRRICVLTQYKAHSLLRHLQMGWSFLRPEMNEFLDLLPAQQRLDEATWYRGTADAVYQNFDIFRAAGPEYIEVLVNCIRHIYKM